MARKPTLDPWRVREEIATAAAKMIAEDGLDFASAKRKAAKLVIGDTRIAGEWLPDNERLEEEVREYQSLFQSESQPAILRRLRRIALDWMDRLSAFNPYLTGAVLNGTAGEHSDIQLQLFSDAGKDVVIFLLNAGIDYDVTETRHFGGREDVETLSFMASSVPRRRDVPAENIRADDADDLLPPMIGIHLAIYSETDLRGALRADSRGRAPRASMRTVAELVAADAKDPHQREASRNASDANDADEGDRPAGARGVDSPAGR